MGMVYKNHLAAINKNAIERKSTPVLALGEEMRAEKILLVRDNWQRFALKARKHVVFGGNGGRDAH